MPVCFINLSRYGPKVPASLSPATYNTAGLSAVGVVLGFGSSSVVVVDVDAAVNGVLPSLTISEVLGGAVAASVWRSGAPKTAVATE
jgi:hypothetical protein